MRIRSTLVFAGICAAACLLAAPSAQAFTLEGGDNKGTPKFDLEEQMRQFRTHGPSGTSSSTGSSQFDTPFGKGQVYFGTQQGPATTFGRALEYRHHFERVVTPENLR